MKRGMGWLPDPNMGVEYDSLSAISGGASSTSPSPAVFWWANGWWGDQGIRPWAVEYAFHHWCCDVPTGRRKGPLWKPGVMHLEAVAGRYTPEDGVGIVAMAEVLHEHGHIDNVLYEHDDLDTVLDALAHAGPVILGTPWLSAMMHPNAAGLVLAQGSVVGHHAVLLNGIGNGMVRMKNSWGRGWGRRGHALIRVEDLDKLMANGAIAAYPIEKAKP